MSRAEQRRNSRRRQAIRAYVGENGGGKSYCATYDLLPSLDRGRPVLSNTPLFDHRTGEPHRSWVPLTDWRQIIAASDCDIFLDEVSGIAEARAFASLPAQLLQVLVQLRKRNLTLSWTSPDFNRADVVLRQVTRVVTVCEGYMPKRLPDSEWSSNRFFRFRTYDSLQWSSVSEGKVQRVTPMWSACLWRPRHPEVERSYDTYGQVGVLGHVDLGGTCIECGGKRQVPKCSCTAGHSDVAKQERGPLPKLEPEVHAATCAQPCAMTPPSSEFDQDAACCPSDPPEGPPVAAAFAASGAEGSLPPAAFLTTLQTMEGNALGR